MISDEEQQMDNEAPKDSGIGGSVPSDTGTNAPDLSQQAEQVLLEQLHQQDILDGTTSNVIDNATPPDAEVGSTLDDVYGSIATYDADTDISKLAQGQLSENLPYDAQGLPTMDAGATPNLGQLGKGSALPSPTVPYDNYVSSLSPGNPGSPSSPSG